MYRQQFARVTAIAVAIFALIPISNALAADYATAEAALRDGIQRLNEKKFDEARAPLEAAIKLADNDPTRLHAYQAVLQVYRRMPEAEPMIGAYEYILEHAQSRAERSIYSRGLASFLFQRGLLDKHVEQHEQRLQKKADDLISLSLLTAVFSSVQRDAARKQEMSDRLLKVEQGLSAKNAEEFEKQAAVEASRASWLWKEAAVAWRDAAQKEKALAAAKKAVETGPVTDGLAHFYHRHLGEVFADCGQSAAAIEHLEKAIAATTIKGYQDDCQKRLVELRAATRP